MSDIKYTQDRGYGHIYRIIGEMSPGTCSSSLFGSLNVTAEQRLPSSESKIHSRIFYPWIIKKAFGEEFVSLRAIYSLVVKHFPVLESISGSSWDGQIIEYHAFPNTWLPLGIR